MNSVLISNVSKDYIYKTIICPYTSPFNQTKDKFDEMMLYKHIINGWLMSIVISVGIIANLIVICALMHENMRRSSTNIYLLALTASNLSSLVLLFISTSVRYSIVYPFRLTYCQHFYENFVHRALPYLTPANHLFQLNGIYLTMAVAIDRLILVRSNSKNIKTKKRIHITLLTIFSIFIFCTLFTLPNWFIYESKMISQNTTVIFSKMPISYDRHDSLSDQLNFKNDNNGIIKSSIEEINNYIYVNTDFGNKSGKLLSTLFFSFFFQFKI
jgi:hypothetical protein